VSELFKGKVLDWWALLDKYKQGSGRHRLCKYQVWWMVWLLLEKLLIINYGSIIDNCGTYPLVIVISWLEFQQVHDEYLQFFMSLSLITLQSFSFMVSSYVSLSFMFWLLFNRTYLLSWTLIHLVPGICANKTLWTCQDRFHTFLSSLQYTHSFSSLGLFETIIVG
jgi:hypothetical protein